MHFKCVALLHFLVATSVIKGFICFVLHVALLRDEVQWLDQLEKKLSCGPRPTCDAEELSEELDVCFHFLYYCFCVNECVGFNVPFDTF